MLSGSIGPRELRVNEKMTLLYVDLCRDGSVRTYYNKPVEIGSIDTLTKRDFSVAIDLKRIPNFIDWTRK